MVVRCPVCDNPNDADHEHCQRCNARIPLGLRQQAMVKKREVVKQRVEYAQGDVGHRDADRQELRRTTGDAVSRRQDIRGLRGDMQVQDTGMPAYSPSDRYGPPPQINSAARTASGRAYVDADRYRQESGGPRVAAGGAPVYGDTQSWQQAQRNDLRDARSQGNAFDAAGLSDEKRAAEQAAQARAAAAPAGPQPWSPAPAPTAAIPAPVGGGWGGHQVSTVNEADTARAGAGAGHSDPNAALDASFGAPMPAAAAPQRASASGSGWSSSGPRSPTRPTWGASDSAAPPSSFAAPVEEPVPVARSGGEGLPPPPVRVRRNEMPPPPSRSSADSSAVSELPPPISGESRIEDAPVAPAAVPRTAGQPDAWLVFLDEHGRERDHMPLRIGKTIIGRSEGEVLLRKDPYVSPWHAQLTVRRNGVTIKDMYSLNGIYRRVERQAVLRDRDRVLVGRQVIRFREGWTEALPDEQGTRSLGGPRPAANARVLVLTDSGEIVDQRVIRETLTIGRAGCDLSIPEDDVLEDRHAQIQWDGGGYFIIDLASRDGVYIAIREETELSDSDVIQIGNQRLRVKRSM